MPLRDIRHQAAVVRDHHLLFIKVGDHDQGRSFWLLPGGGREGDESFEDCVCREVHEESGLVVAVDRVLFDVEVQPNDFYERVRTYLCSVVSGIPTPGAEPEALFNATILEAAWFDLRNLNSWLAEVLGNRLTMHWIHPIRATLGYQ